MGSRNGVWPWLVWSLCLAGKSYILKALLNSKEMKKKKLGVERNGVTKVDFHVSELCAVGS